MRISDWSSDVCSSDLDKAGVRMFKTYLETLRREARLRFEAGMAVEEAADDIVFDPPYDSWLCPERVTGSVNFLFRQWGHPNAETDFMRIFDMMAGQANLRPQSRTGRTCAGCPQPPTGKPPI